MNENANQGRTTEVRLTCWEEFEEKAAAFDDPDRKLWDEVWFRGQADARWALLTTLERRSKGVNTISMYLKLISEIKPAIETFTREEFQMPKQSEIEERCRQYDLSMYGAECPLPTLQKPVGSVRHSLCQSDRSARTVGR
jgi:hypothetical protein